MELRIAVGLRALSGWLLIAVVAALAVALEGQRHAHGEEHGQAAQAPGGSGEAAGQGDQLRLGGQVYALQCAVCHGTDGAGTTGAGPLDGPPVNDVDVAYVDLTLRTGRMPLRVEEVGILDDQLDDRQREAVVAWMRREFDLPGEIPAVAGGSSARGQELYVRHCAACHGSTGRGGVSAGGTAVRAVRGVEAVAIAEAIRVGPFRMPRFDADVLDDEDVADIASYVAEMTARPATPLGLVEMDRVEAAVLVLALVGAMVGVMLLVAAPVPRPDEGSDDDGAVGA